MILTVTLNPSLDEWVRVESLRLGALNRAESFVRYPGGKGINVSRVVHELRSRTHAFGVAGGPDGQILDQLLDRLRIPHTFVTVSGSTRNNYKVLSHNPPVLTEINTPGPDVPVAVLRALKRTLLAARPRPSCVVLSGSLPHRVALTTYKTWIAEIQRRKIPCLLDASGGGMSHGVKAKPWMIKPNLSEAEELLGRKLASRASQIDAVKQLTGSGIGVVILSLAGKGALMATRRPAGVWLGIPPKIKINSAVGAGDSLVGGFAVGWAAGRSLVEAFRLGIASGTATAMTPGTELCHRSDVLKVLRKISIRQIG
jgi:6-phosphofructokinase 2